MFVFPVFKENLSEDKKKSKIHARKAHKVQLYQALSSDLLYSVFNCCLRSSLELINNLSENS